MSIHEARDKIVALHPVFVRRPIGEMGKGCFSQFVRFEFPKIAQLQPHSKAHGPIVVFARDWIIQRTALGMALNAGVIGLNVVQACRIDDISAGGLRHMFTPGSMAFFTADVPF